MSPRARRPASVLAVPSLLARKRDGGALDDGEIEALIAGAAAGMIPDYQLSALLMARWLAFARTDQPGHPRRGDWIADDAERRATMIFDKRSALEDAPSEEERAAFDGVL